MPLPELNWSTLASPVVTAGSMGLFLLLGLAFPRVQPAINWKDTGINLLTGGALFLLRVALIAVIGANLGEQGLVDLAFLSERPILGGVLAFLVVDLTRYWVHRAHHRVPFLWTFHRTHHSSEHINATSGLRMHVVDMVQLTLIPVLLFRVLFNFHLQPGVLEGVLLIGVAMDGFQHANVRFPLDRTINRAWSAVFNNPGFHAWHHTRDGHLCDGNYGQALTIWDRLFGSDVTQDAPPELYGLDAHSALENSLLGLHLLRAREPESPS